MENLDLDIKKRKLRSINETLKSIKNEDPETAITRYMIDTLVKEGKVYNIKIGNKVLIDYDETLTALGVYYE